MRTYEVTRKVNELDEIEPTLTQNHGMLMVDTVEADEFHWSQGRIEFLIIGDDHLQHSILAYNDGEVLFVEDVTETEAA